MKDTAELLYTGGALSRRYGVPAGTISGWIKRGVLRPTKRVGLIAVFAEADLPAVEAVLAERGYSVSHGTGALDRARSDSPTQEEQTDA